VELDRSWLVISTGLALLCAACSATNPVLPPKDQPKVLMLGEVHDNPDGHRARYEVLRELIINDGWRPAIVMEQFDREQQALLDQAQRECGDADCLISRAGSRNWEWPLYKPLIQLALDYRLPLFAANISRADDERVMYDGLGSALDAETIIRFHLSDPLPTDIQAEETRSVIEGHCHMLPADMTAGTVTAQIARDVWMAKSLLDGLAVSHGAVLIAGNGHVRRDVGVIRWLPPEVVRNTQVHGFVEPGESGENFDVVHVVKAHERPDPCKAFQR
jgi:uncharacterized iron-regulated protein